MPVKSVFLLKTTNTDSFSLEPLNGGGKIDPILANTYRPRFLEGLGNKKTHFKHCAAVAGNASVCKVTRPIKGFLLDELMDLVEKEF